MNFAAYLNGVKDAKWTSWASSEGEGSSGAEEVGRGCGYLHECAAEGRITCEEELTGLWCASFWV